MGILSLVLMWQAPLSIVVLCGKRFSGFCGGDLSWHCAVVLVLWYCVVNRSVFISCYCGIVWYCVVPLVDRSVFMGED